MAQSLDTTHDDRGDQPPVPDEARGDARRPSAKVAAVPALLALAIFVGGIGVLGYPAELVSDDGRAFDPARTAQTPENTR